MANKEKKGECPLVYLEWCDAITNNDGWKDMDEVLEWSESANWLIQECGFILKETKEYIVFAHRISPPADGHEAVYGIITKIPKPWIRKRVELNEFI